MIHGPPETKTGPHTVICRVQPIPQPLSHRCIYTIFTVLCQRSARYKYCVRGDHIAPSGMRSVPAGASSLRAGASPHTHRAVLSCYSVILFSNTFLFHFCKDTLFQNNRITKQKKVLIYKGKFVLSCLLSCCYSDVILRQKPRFLPFSSIFRAPCTGPRVILNNIFTPLPLPYGCAMTLQMPTPV